MTPTAQRLRDILWQENPTIIHLLQVLWEEYAIDSEWFLLSKDDQLFCPNCCSNVLRKSDFVFYSAFNDKEFSTCLDLSVPLLEQSDEVLENLISLTESND